MKKGGTKSSFQEEIVANYRQYIRMELPKSALALLEAHPRLLEGINPYSVLKDAERGIK